MLHALSGPRPWRLPGVGQRMLRVATKYDLPVYGAIGSFWLGATQAMHGDVSGGLLQMEPTFEPLDGIGLFVCCPLW